MKAYFTASLLSSKESKWVQYLRIFVSISVLIGKRPISARKPMLEAFEKFYKNANASVLCIMFFPMTKVIF